MTQKTWLRSIALVAVLAAPTPASAAFRERALEGDYPQTVEVEGKALRLVGSGLREKWFFDVYLMGAYSESGSCDPAALISKDEVKHFRINTLRSVSARNMAESLRSALEKNLPLDASPELRDQIATFLTYFKHDLAEGANLELTYVPGSGTTVRQNGVLQGAVTPGKAFADLLWSAYFSAKTCCPALKRQILTACFKRGAG